MTTLIKNQIITKRERTGRKVLWIAETALLKFLAALTEKFLRKKARYSFKQSVPKSKRKRKVLPDTGASWRWAKLEGTFYYDYDRIPDDAKAKYRSLLPSKESILEMYNQSLSESRKSQFETLVEKALQETYKDYLHCYRAYPETARVNLSKACAVLEVAINHIKEQDLNVKQNVFFIEFAEVVKSYAVPYLPKNFRRLKQKVKMILEGTAIAEMIDLPRRGNSNSKKYDDPQLMSWLYTLRNSPKNFTNIYIIRKIMQMCVMLDKATPSESWFSNILASHNMKYLTAEGRFGSKGRKSSAYRTYIPLQGALHAGDCWMADGTRVNMIGHKTADGKEKFLYIIAIRDVYSGDVVGVHLDTKEDRWGYVNALRMAVEFTGYLPYEFVIDRFPGHTTDEWQNIKKQLETAGTKVTVTSLAQGKAAVERMFGTIQTVFMQDSPYYYGEGIQSRRDYAHRTSEYLYQTRKRANKEGWNYDTAWQEMMKILDCYRTTRLSYYSRKYKNIDLSPKQLHDQSEKPNVIHADYLMRIELFGLEKKATIRGSIIKTEIQRIAYTYQVTNYEVIAHHRNVILKYDMEDLEKVYLFDANGEFLTIAEETRKIQKYGPDADVKALGKSKKEVKEIEEKRKSDIEEKMGEAAELELLMNGMNDKGTSGNAETGWLLDRMGEWKDTNKPRLSKEIIEEDIEVEIDVRSQY